MSTTLVLVDRRFPQPADLDELQAREDAHAWCLDQHEVRFLHTLFSFDRSRMTCIYRAPDAESVRITQRTAGMPFTAVHAVSSTAQLDALALAEHRDDRGSLVVVVRRFSAPPTDAHLAEMMAGSEWCFEANGIARVDSYIAADRTWSQCVFSAPEAEVVRRANRIAALPVDALFPATLHYPPSVP